jgi:hypothetical protein
MMVFCTTVLVTVSTDLLLGIISGMVLEFVLNVSFAWPTARVAVETAPGFGGSAGRAVSRVADLFRNPVTSRELIDGQYHVYFGRPLVAFNSLHVSRELTRIPQQATAVYFHLTDDVTVIDHTSSTNLLGFANDYEKSGKGRIQFTGLDEMFTCSTSATCVRLGANSMPATARGGISALMLKAGQSLHNLKRIKRVEGLRPVVPPRFADPESGNLALFSLTASHKMSETATDPSCLGPDPSHDHGNELDWMSLATGEDSETDEVRK